MNDLRAPSFIARSEMSMFPPEPTYVSIKAFFIFAYDAMPAVTSLDLNQPVRSPAASAASLTCASYAFARGSVNCSWFWQAL
ncbi:hypothetical protein TSUD_291810 [Trifolium subterraneum]|uniref:Uncharacterized protein n=1 Tax=Trifolium subterraneum TaxID=3900 RepID=A0A2Z6PFK5_TRISU|nr:hypothetical protein TSUD_291810 [Trifolium subterraneum]